MRNDIAPKTTNHYSEVRNVRGQVINTWIVEFGGGFNRFYTEYHAEQLCRALQLSGTPYKLITPKPSHAAPSDA